MRLHSGNVVTVQKPIQLLAGQSHDIVTNRVWPLESLPFQALVPEHEAAPYPGQDLYLGTLAIAKNEYGSEYLYFY